MNSFSAGEEGFDNRYQDAIHALIREHQLACEALTANQLATVIGQALASGDIIKHVRVTDHAQAVLYIPYAEREHLDSRVRQLEAENNALKVALADIADMPEYDQDDAHRL